MKILFVHNFFRFWGGTDATVMWDKEILESHGHTVDLYQRQSSEIQNYSRLQKARLPAQILYSTRTQTELWALLRRNRYDVVHIHNVRPLISPSVYYALGRKRLPIVQTVQDHQMFCVNSLCYVNNHTCELCVRGNFLHAIPRRCYQKELGGTAVLAAIWAVHRFLRTFSRTITLFIANSHFLARKLQERGIRKERILVKENIPTETYRYNPKPQDYALYIGRLDRPKGVLTLLEAFREIRDVPLRIAGNGPAEEECRQFVARHGMTHVSFVGFVAGQEKADMIQHALFSVFPSLSETFGIAALESLAYGTPVVASRLGGLQEIVDDGRSGYLFAPGDPLDLREKVHALASSRAACVSMRASARKKYETHYTREHAYTRLMEAYERAGQLSRSR